MKKNVWTVKDLKEALSQFDNDDVIVLTSDSEGNCFDTLYTVEAMQYISEHHEVRYRELTDDMREQGYTEEDVTTDGQPAVVLWP